jgi:regulator of replication initiation timing
VTPGVLIPELQRLRLENKEFKASLGYLVKNCFKRRKERKKKKKGRNEDKRKFSSFPLLR